MAVRIAVDCMGGDHGLVVTVPAARTFARIHVDANLLLVGDAQQIKAKLAGAGADERRFEVVPASEVVAMDDPIATALRSKRDSSMRVAVNLVKEGRADAAISAGNTGALMAISRFVLKTMEGIDRPAIATVVPNEKGGTTTVLDLGANVDCTAQHLLEFALLGAALVAATEEKERPSVGLLNIGEEIIKGSEVVKQAAELLRASPLNFYGNVEGNDIYKGTTDVVVCDGFVGNVLLKTSEGLVLMLAGMLKQEFGRSVLTRLLGGVSWPVLRRFKQRVDPRRYNGASLLGLRGIVVKSHGSADAEAFGHALRRSYEMVRHRVLDRTVAAMQPLLPQLQAVRAGADPASPPPAQTARSSPSQPSQEAA